MSKGLHTPGPWKAVQNSHYWEVRTNNDECVGDAVASQFIGNGTLKKPNPAEEHNARLMAAAPDLLEAAKVADEALKAAMIEVPRPAIRRKITEARNGLCNAVAKAASEGSEQ